MKSITYIISDIDKSIAFEWIVEVIDKSKFNLSFILINSENSYLKNYLEEKNFNVYNLTCKRKQNILGAVWKCRLILKEIKPDVVHCHLIMANLIGLTAAKLIGIKKRIYTRHYSTYHHQYFPAAVKWDKLNNRLATHIVAISKVVEDVLVEQENVKLKKISLIYHGFKLDAFFEKNTETIQLLNDIYNPLNKRPVIGVISRFTELKGVQYIVPAFKDILIDKPDALLLLFNASGDYEKNINKQLEELPATSYKKIIFENDITSLYHLFDIFIHVPINSTIEAFGQTYIECMASGTPLIATKSGIANEILINKENAIIVDYQNSDEIYQAIRLLLTNPDLCDRITRNGKKIIEEKFQLESMIEKLENLYLQ